MELGAGVSAFTSWQGDAGLVPLTAVDAPGRMRRQFDELVAFTQQRVRAAQAERDRWWSTADRLRPERWQASLGGLSASASSTT